MELDAHLDTLTHKHAALENAIEEEAHRPLPNQLAISELKREKLRVKDEIERLRGH